MKDTNILIVGVGGQGTLLASVLLGKLAMEQGYDVKLSEVPVFYTHLTPKIAFLIILAEYSPWMVNSSFPFTVRPMALI